MRRRDEDVLFGMISVNWPDQKVYKNQYQDRHIQSQDLGLGG